MYQSVKSAVMQLCLAPHRSWHSMVRVSRVSRVSMVMDKVSVTEASLDSHNYPPG